MRVKLAWHRAHTMFTSSLIISCNWRRLVGANRNSAKRNQTNQRMINGKEKTASATWRCPILLRPQPLNPKAKVQFFHYFCRCIFLLKTKVFGNGVAAHFIILPHIRWIALVVETIVKLENIYLLIAKTMAVISQMQTSDKTIFYFTNKRLNWI